MNGGADSEDLRPSNPFDLADEGGTAPKAGPDLRIAGSLRPPCQDPPFDRPEELWWRNRRACNGAGTRASSRISFYAPWMRLPVPATPPAAGSTPLSTSRRTTRSTGRRVTSSATTSPPMPLGYSPYTGTFFRVRGEPLIKVWIDQDLCTGDGLCEEICPAVFTLLDDGLAYVKQDDTVLNEPGGSSQMATVGSDLEDAVTEAAEECPGECIFIVTE